MPKPEESKKAGDLVSPQDTPGGGVSRELQGDPDDQRVVRDMQGAISDKTVYPSDKMKGTYLITNASQEAAIAKIIVKSIKDSLEKKNFF